MSQELYTPANTPVESIPDIVKGLRAHFKTHISKSIEWRKQQLLGLAKILEDHESEWVEAQIRDLGAPKYETTMLLQNCINESRHAASKLEEWIYPEQVSNSWLTFPGTTKLCPEPYGVVCDFIPFNYPMFLGFSTLIPILAAGNVCLFKPSSNTPACAALYQKYFQEYLDNDGIKVVVGPSSVCDTILDQRFDFIFYTGSPKIARNVLTHAAKYITPCLLELGGKSPAYIDENLSMKTSVRRLVFGKFFNGGQTCVCPDYVLCHKKVADEFCNELLKVITEFYGEPSEISKDMCHIVNDRHFDRLERVITTSGGKIIREGIRDKATRYIGPTVVRNPSLDSEMMTEEIFGPIIPVIDVDGIDEAIDFINEREKPLALYAFTSNSKLIERFTRETSSGVVLQNDCTYHVSSGECPFGGVGNSGMGQYHGKKGVFALSHVKPVMTHGTAIDVTMRYPPYTNTALTLLRHFV